MRLLVDEDLSPRLTHVAHAAGCDATSVRDRGRLGSHDLPVARLCLDEERVLVTNNIGHFRSLTAQTGIHPGIIHLPLGTADEMCASLEAALGYIKAHHHEVARTEPEFMINRVIEVVHASDCREYEWPPSPGPEP